MYLDITIVGHIDLNSCIESNEWKKKKVKNSRVNEIGPRLKLNLTMPTELFHKPKPIKSNPSPCLYYIYLCNPLILHQSLSLSQSQIKNLGFHISLSLKPWQEKRSQRSTQRRRSQQKLTPQLQTEEEEKLVGLIGQDLRKAAMRSLSVLTARSQLPISSPCRSTMMLSTLSFLLTIPSSSISTLPMLLNPVNPALASVAATRSKNS